MTDPVTLPGASIYHLSSVTCHLSPVTCHLSPVTCHLSQCTTQRTTEKPVTDNSALTAIFLAL